MTHSVLDSSAAIRRILDAPTPQRADLVRRMWAPMAGLYHFVPGGVDLAEVHQQNFGFTPEAASERVRTAVQTLDAADAWTRAASALARAEAAVRAADPAASIPDVTLLLLVGDPENKHFMQELQGLSAFGGISGYIVITVWPTPTVLERIEAIVAHEFHHNVRYMPDAVTWNHATVTVGEQVVAEGLADVFAAELYGPAGYTHFVSDATREDDAVLDRVRSGLALTGMQNFTAWIHGDASARLFGAEPVGLPTGAGYAAGVRLVRSFMDSDGGTAAQHVRTSSDHILGQ